MSWEEAKKYIPNGCQTLSKRPEAYVNGVYPKFLVSGHGCEVIDDAGISYIDYISGLGINLIGYNHPAIDSAVKETINSGQVLLSLPHPKETELAKRLCRLFEYDKVKFFKTGSEATSAAIRLARAHTSRETILTCGYNGWHDWAAVRYDRNAGVPLNEPTLKFIYNDIASLKNLFQSCRAAPVAAVILEPVVFDEPAAGFLEELIALAHQYGSVVIFDEVVTGFRFSHRGAGNLFNVKADLVCIGKALGNGYAIAGVLGNEDIMSVFERDDFMASGTFSGELVGISAAIAVLDYLAWNSSPQLWNIGELLKMGFNEMTKTLGMDASCAGYAPRTQFRFPSDLHRALFWQECVRRGILFGYANFVSYSHGNMTTNKTLDVCREALKVLKTHWSDPKTALAGPTPVAALR